MSNASNKFYGIVGFVETVEDEYGVARPVNTERHYYGDILNLTSRWRQTEYLNNDKDITERISIMSDPYAIDHYSKIKYIDWMGVRWEVNSIELHYPRLILNLGGVYNGEQT